MKSVVFRNIWRHRFRLLESTRPTSDTAIIDCEVDDRHATRGKMIVGPNSALAGSMFAAMLASRDLANRKN
jgi:hypothetical protein